MQGRSYINVADFNEVYFDKSNEIIVCCVDITYSQIIDVNHMEEH